MAPGHSWGESSGAVSAGLLMVAGKNGDPGGLFRGAFMVGVLVAQSPTSYLEPTAIRHTLWARGRR